MNTKKDGSVGKTFIKQLEQKVIDGISITFEEALELASLTEEEDLLALYASANRIRALFCGDDIDLCTIMNAKSGRCSEDCKFCAQSAHFNTNIETYNLVSLDEVLHLAKENENEGVHRFSLVTSGKGLKGKDFENILQIYDELQTEVQMDLCASLGILQFEQLEQLKDKGITMYHHNLETSEEYYQEICTTHTYEERIETIRAAKKAGMAICSGGIIGLGESFQDRIKLAFQLQALEVRSIPINVLNPIDGTPLEHVETPSQTEILKTVAIFRFINPDSYIRLGGGRNLIDHYGERCFSAGANATITGNYLTTSGNNINDDKNMIEKLQLRVR